MKKAIVLPNVDDNQRLTIRDYKRRLYEEILRKHQEVMKRRQANGVSAAAATCPEPPRLSCTGLDSKDDHHEQQDMVHDSGNPKKSARNALYAARTTHGHMSQPSSHRVVDAPQVQ